MDFQQLFPFFRLFIEEEEEERFSLLFRKIPTQLTVHREANIHKDWLQNSKEWSNEAM